MGGLLSPFQVYTQQACFCSPVTPTNLRHSRCRKEYIQQNGNGTKIAFRFNAARETDRSASGSSSLGIVKALKTGQALLCPQSNLPHLQRRQVTAALRAGPEQASCLITCRSWCLPHPRLLNTDRSYNGIMGTPKGL